MPAEDPVVEYDGLDFQSITTFVDESDDEYEDVEIVGVDEPQKLPDTLDAPLPQHVFDCDAILACQQQHCTFLDTWAIAPSCFPYSSMETKYLHQWMFANSRTSRNVIDTLLHMLHDGFDLSQLATDTNTMEREKRGALP